MEYRKLSSIAKISSGQNAPQGNNYYSNGGFNFIKVSNLDDLIEDGNEERASKVTNDAIIKYKLKKYPKESILFAKSGLSCNKNRVYLTNSDAFIVNHLCVIYNIDLDFNPIWLMLFIKFHNVTRYIKDESYPSISLSDIGNINVPIIGINIQNEIVKKLERIARIIKYNRNMISKLDNIVKSQFIEMFGDPILNEKGWSVRELNELTDVRDGTHDSPKYYNSGYPFVTSKNLINGIIDFSTCNLICEEDYLHFNDRSCVDDGDILMPMIGTIGGAIVVNKDRDFAIKNVALIKFNKNNEIINRMFVHNILNSDSMNEYFNHVKKGGTQNFISLGLIRKIPTVLPPIELQNKFASFVQQIDKSKFIVQKQIKLLEELLEKKMNEYFGD